MATHSGILVWKIPWMKEPIRLQSMGLQRIGHNWATALNSSHTSASLLMSSLVGFLFVSSKKVSFMKAEIVFVSAHQQTLGFKFYQTFALPTRVRSSLSHHQSLHQEACPSLLASSTREHTKEARRTTFPQPSEWKPQSQKENQNEKAFFLDSIHMH